MKISITIGGSSIDEVVKATERAAAAGFTSAWLANIFGVDALTAIAVAGRHVPGIHLGTAVVPTFPRHPHALAQQAMSTWDATGGRFTLGIGLSHQIVIESMFGLSYDKPAVHMREYLSVLLPLLRDGMVSFSGERYTVNAPLERPATPGSPPVLIACCARAWGWRGKVGTTAVPRWMPGTWRPATAMAVRASTPKMFASQADVNPAAAARSVAFTTSSMLLPAMVMLIFIRPPRSCLRGGAYGDAHVDR